MVTTNSNNVSHDALTKSCHDPQEESDNTVLSVAPPMPQNIDRYEIRSVLGSGGFGRVYRAFDPLIRRDVALKVPRQPDEW